jgi:SAM-dependent methyltransferase
MLRTRRTWSGLAIAVALVATSVPVRSQAPPSAVVPIPFADARPILQVLRDELLPDALETRTPQEREAMWPRWVATRDAAIRERVAQGDEESVINLLLFGTTFTKRPRPAVRELEALVARPAEGLAALRGRVDDFIAAVVSPGNDERLLFARTVIVRAGLDPTTAGMDRMRRHLESRIQAVAVGSASASSTADVGAASTLYRDRGLSSDTSLLVDYGVDRALEAAARTRQKAAAVRRVAIVGPGLDFTDKLGGYDFYPQQTIQPFAVIDSLIRHGLGDAAALRVTAFDLSPRVLQHLDAARGRSAAGAPYGLVLPRNLDRSWTPGLVSYWQRLGDRIGDDAAAVTPPATAGRLQVRSVRVRPSVVLVTATRDLNIVLAREEAPAAEQFDLVIATNILVYYDVFEQALAMANIARMLRPGGLFLTNTRLVELPGSPLRSAGYTDSVYTTGPRGDETGDRIWWYER